MLSRLQAELNTIFNKPIRLSYPRQGELSTNSFVASGNANWAAQKILDCRYVARAQENNGWVIFWLTDDFYNQWIELCPRILCPNLNDLVQNRLNLWLQKGLAPCPKDENLRRVILRTAAKLATDNDILTLSHHLMGSERIAFESSLGGCAKLLLSLICRN